MKIYLTSLGCKLNQAEIESLARQVEASGHELAAEPMEADWAVVNTCTVTHIAARKSRQLLRQLRKGNPGIRIAVTGCYADRAGEVVCAMEGVSLVVANGQKEQVVERILGTRAGGEGAETAIKAQEPHRLPLGHTRAFVKIQDGCDNRCAYCVVSLARGPQHSRPPEQILDEIRAREGEGYREVVLTGVNAGAYGRDSSPGGALPPAAGWTLGRLVQEILEGTTAPRVRLSSVEPWDLDLGMLELWANPRLCRHLHLPLQSGCNETLRRMRRRYTTERFENLVAGIRQWVPEMAITTDLIVGFPGETDREFNTTMAFVERLGFSRLHVFKYSRRPGTAASEMPDQVPAPVAHQRSAVLIALGQQLALAYHCRFVKREVVVLLESAGDELGFRVWSGLTDNYLRVSVAVPGTGAQTGFAEPRVHTGFVPMEGNLANTFVTVHCTSASAEGLRGEIIQVTGCG